ncbi:MAG: hypothetical protein GY913_06005 [Proteobacteria bacterium]|nr:hypothetical protein [Pseudomonadota bacterium]MCP4916459.1 hypothetical protein [Pseudomonadota bacterium]
MKATRRGFLAGASAALVAGCTKATGDSGDSAHPEGAAWRDPEPEAWVPDEAVDADAFAWDVRATDVQPDAAWFSVRTTEALVELVIVAAQDGAWIEVQRVEVEVEDVARVRVEGLTSDTAHRCALMTADGRRSEVVRFRTALGEGESRLLVIGATSCLGADDRPWPTLTNAAAEELDVMIMLGDTIYSSSTTYEGYSEEWATQVQYKGLQDLQRSTSFVATWDDHEVANNWYLGDNVSEDQLEAATRAFKDHMPMEEGPGGLGIWRVLRWGEVCDLIVLDSRSERIKDERYLSDEQMAWLKETLSTSTARFKLILNSVPITDLYSLFLNVEASDRWQGYEAEREDLLGHIDDQGIEGVLWLSGDFHYGALNYVSPQGRVGADQMEVMCGPSGSFINAIATLHEGDDQYPILLGVWNYVRLELDPKLGTVLVQFVDDANNVVAEQLLAI